MKSKVRITLIFLVLFLFSSFAGAQIVVVKKPVRKKVVVVKPAKPGKNHVWIGGRWVVSGGKYVWTKGKWSRKKPGKNWVPGHWKKVQAGWKWIPGHWRVIR